MISLKVIHRLVSGCISDWSPSFCPSIIRISLTAKNPITTTMKSIPSYSSIIPKVNRLTPVVESIPIAAIASPKNAEMMAFSRLPWLKLDRAINAKTIKTVYSAGPKLIASSANFGAKKARKKMEIVPPMKEAIADMASAFPPRPCLAIA